VTHHGELEEMLRLGIDVRAGVEQDRELAEIRSTAAIAGRSTPGRTPMTNIAMAIAAPVLPAEMKADAVPPLTSSAATIELGGSRGRREATGRGVMICCDKALAKLGIKKEGCRVVVQGFGNVGSMAAELMHKAGYKIIGLADIGGGLYNEKGLDVPKAIDWVYTQKKPLQDFPGGGTKMSSRDVLFQPCEIAIPAAIENQITEKNANQVQARILCEGANGPTTWQADAIIDAKGIFTVPDILGNAGGVTVSYFEWVQDRQGFFWRESEVNERLFDVMDNAFDEVVRFAGIHKVNNRIAAYMLAIDRVASALKLRGIYA